MPLYGDDARRLIKMASSQDPNDTMTKELAIITRTAMGSNMTLQQIQRLAPAPQTPINAFKQKIAIITSATMGWEQLKMQMIKELEGTNVVEVSRYMFVSFSLPSHPFRSLHRDIFSSNHW